MTRTLVRKELAHHWMAFAIAGLLTITCGAMLMAVSLVRGQAGTPFEGYRLFVAFFAVVLSIVLCHRLVVLEYQARTQLFLEGLPFSRWRMLGIKYALGLGIGFALLGVMFCGCVLVAARHDPPSAKFLVIAGARAASYAWCAYNFFFVMGLLGRYRAAIYIALGFVLLGLQEMSALELSRFGPFALVNATFPYEADVLPWEALRETWFLAGASLGGAVLLGLMREGSVAALLAERMSHREKVFISALLVGLLWSVTLVSEKAKREPFDLPEAVTESAPGVLAKVAVARTGDGPPAARELAQTITTELAGLKEYLGTGDLPPVFITERRDLDAKRYERGELEHHHGVHAQVNFQSPEWRTSDFMPWVLREVLAVASNDRAKHESRRFVLDGFALFWSERARREPDPKLVLRALYGVRGGFAPQDFSRWLSFRERVGDPIASAVAWSALESVARLCSTNEFREFVRATLAVGAPKDFRGAFGAGGEPWDRALEEKAKLPVRRFYQAWQDDLALAAKECGGKVGVIPQVQARVRVVNLSRVSRQVLYSVSITPPPTNSTAVVSFLHCGLPPYDEEVDEQDLLREQSTVAAARERELPGGYSRYQRLYWTGAFHSAELGCEVISGWKRMELP